MTVPEVGTWRATRPGGRYYAWLARHPSLEDSPELRDAWAEAWRQSSWATLKLDTDMGLRMSELTRMFAELVQLRDDLAAREHYETELEASSAYWRTRE